MGISIPSSTSLAETYKTPRVKPTAKELAELKKEPTKVATQGDIYTSMPIHFKELSREELRNETITVDKSKYTYVSHSDGTKNEPNRIVVIRDPENNNKYVTMELSKTSIDQLKEKFGDVNNFFERSDGVLRLNGEAEAFVAGWLQNIKIDRNYTKSDADGNGLIEGDEAKTLMIRFEGEKNYDYIGKKVIKINLGVSSNYQQLDPTDPSHFIDEDGIKEASDKETSTEKKLLDDSVEKAVQHTLKMDTNLDGIVTQEEMLVDTLGKDYRKKIISDTEKFHRDMLDIRTDLNDDTKIQKYDFGHAPTKEEQEATLQQMRESALKISTSDLLTFAGQNDKNIADTLKQLQIQTAKSTYSDEEEDVQKTSG